MSDALVEPTDDQLATPASPARVGMVCACGWGLHLKARSELTDVMREYYEHLAKRHPKAFGYNLTLAFYPEGG